MDHRDRITINQDGVPCIRGTRIRVADILNLLANGLSMDEVLKKFSDLEKDDILAALQFAARGRDGGPKPAA